MPFSKKFHIRFFFGPSSPREPRYRRKYLRKEQPGNALGTQQADSTLP